MVLPVIRRRQRAGTEILGQKVGYICEAIVPPEEYPQVLITKPDWPVCILQPVAHLPQDCWVSPSQENIFVNSRLSFTLGGVSHKLDHHPEPDQRVTQVYLVYLKLLSTNDLRPARRCVSKQVSSSYIQHTHKSLKIVEVMAPTTYIYLQG